jgi:F-type H+-transporting ATPase subunit b
MNPVLLQTIGSIFNFLLFAFVLAKFALPQAKNLIATRQKEAHTAYASAENAKKEALAHLHNVEARLSNIDQELAAIQTNADSTAKMMIEDGAKQTAHLVDRLQQEASTEADRLKSAAVQDIKNQMLAISLNGAQANLGNHMTGDIQKSLVQDMIRKLEAGQLVLN